MPFSAPLASTVAVTDPCVTTGAVRVMVPVMLPSVSFSWAEPARTSGEPATLYKPVQLNANGLVGVLVAVAVGGTGVLVGVDVDVLVLVGTVVFVGVTVDVLVGMLVWVGAGVLVGVSGRARVVAQLRVHPPELPYALKEKTT